MVNSYVILRSLGEACLGDIAPILLCRMQHTVSSKPSGLRQEHNKGLSPAVKAHSSGAQTLQTQGAAAAARC